MPSGALAITLALSSCSGDGATTTAMAPSSFAGITDEIDVGLDADIDWIVAGSSRLVRQLADGAEADLLITADAETMSDAIDRQLVRGEAVTIAANRLVVAVAPGNPGDVDELDDLLDPSLLVGICATEVPCGRLAARAQERLGMSIPVDTEEPNVRSLALKIKGGELDAGLVYATDAEDLGLDTIGEAQLDGFVTEYRAASVNGAPSEIIDFLLSDSGRALLASAGFQVP
jgi:molybdate transport system substrate-binding protein